MPDLILTSEPSTKSFAETYDAWPDVLACAADGTWRLIRSKDDKPATQWIIQRRSGEQWNARMFFQSGDAMRRYRRDTLRLRGTADRKDIDGAFTDRVIGEVVDGLPERCPQREAPLVSEGIKASSAARLAKAREARGKRASGLAG